MNKTQQVIDIEAQISEDMSVSPKDIKFKNDCKEAEIWMLRELKRGLIPTCLHNPMILHHLDNNDLHSVRDVAKALVEFENYEEELANECAD